jgi:ABC-type tungstate transport system substrate-binding protein
MNREGPLEQFTGIATACYVSLAMLVLPVLVGFNFTFMMNSDRQMLQIYGWIC